MTPSLAIQTRTFCSLSNSKAKKAFPILEIPLINNRCLELISSKSQRSSQYTRGWASGKRILLASQISSWLAHLPKTIHLLRVKCTPKKSSSKWIIQIKRLTRLICNGAVPSHTSSTGEPHWHNTHWNSQIWYRIRCQTRADFLCFRAPTTTIFSSSHKTRATNLNLAGSMCLRRQLRAIPRTT